MTFVLKNNKIGALWFFLLVFLQVGWGVELFGKSCMCPCNHLILAEL